jgi:DNA-3-methyladenine glycosylase
LRKRFYERDPAIVARELLGNLLVRRLCSKTLSGLIVETEAYYGSEDPASRACHGMKNFNRLMWGEPGLAFIYNVHKYWMFNIVAHEMNGVGAVLIRAIEPTEGIETMKKNRGVEKATELTNGPGKLSEDLRIDKSLNGTHLSVTDSEVFVAENTMKFKIASSNRIGVKEDLKRKLRFYIEGNRFVSRK